MWNFILHKCSLSIFSYTKYDNFFFITFELKKAWLIHSQTCVYSSILVNAFTFAIHSEKQWMHSIHHSFRKKVNNSIHHSFENESIHFQFIFNSWNHATLFIFMRWFCLISCECRSARLLRNWRRFSRRFFRSRPSTKIEFVLVSN